MSTRTNDDDGLQLDPSTSRAVARGIGEKLKQTIGFSAPFPDRLQHLLNELQAREAHEPPADDKPR
ncbi:hypothetical protein X566_19225 [Afipia sp. P52-10]|jgi:hypothetical protein|uniref:hypothetical protein n=1 Tax=Afipia sp. P52-10 TaxID=1429916 RepID=UPI0003DF3BA7|nr:hypothetical protein [Afipia sp. P52-10]ETR74921.1 hypothetical protein X566_19225 [Afipia sp. P52-10]